MVTAHFTRCEGVVCRCEARRYSLALLVAGLTFLIELFGSWMTNSVSLLSDAIHLLTDCVDLMIGLRVSMLVQQRTFEEQIIRAQGGVLSACLLFGLVGFILWESIPRLFHPEEVASIPMLFIATIGLFGNLLQLRIIEAGEENHRTQKSLVLHFASDVLISVAVILGGLAAYFLGLFVLDPIISIGVAGFIGWKSVHLFYDSWREFSL